MTTQPEPPDEDFMSIPPEEIARANAQLDDPNFVRPPVEWLEDGPDPFGMQWKWAEPPGERPKAPAVIPTPEATPDEPNTSTPRVIRFPTYALRTAIAASLLIGFGVLVGNRLGGGDAKPLAFAVTLGEDTVRGPDSVGSLTVVNHSDARAFVTIVGVKANGTAAFHYRENQKFIDLEPKATRLVGNLPASFDDARSLIVVLTTTPSGDALRQVVGSIPISTETPQETQRAILKGLLEMGYRGSAAELVEPVRRPK